MKRLLKASAASLAVATGSLVVLAPAAASAQALAPASAASRDRCVALVDIGMGVTITAAEITDSNWRSPPMPTPGRLADQGPTRTAAVNRITCRVVGHFDGDIGFEVWLPVDGWNGRFLGTGTGGNAGFPNFVDMARGVELGFAAASTDTGHAADDVSWVTDPRRSANYAQLAHHRLAVIGKAMVERYYGTAAHHAYFVGCSGGGRQAAKELQDFPTDYDGVIVGAPGYDLPGLSARHLLASLHGLRNPASLVDGETWQWIGQQATKACDGDDGLLDGIVNDPRRCSFDVAALACAAPSSPTAGPCLTPLQMSTVRETIEPLYAGSRMIDAGLLPGVTPRPGNPPELAQSIFGRLVHGDPNWDPLTFSPDDDVPAAWAAMPLMNAERTDLTAFAQRGGKAIFYHGLIDPATLVQPTIAYVDAAQRDSASAKQDFLRLYLVPGMLHCSRGPGADMFGGAGDRWSEDNPETNILSALVDWVERDRAPDSIVAAKVEEGEVQFTRTLCPHPLEVFYDGVGDPKAASSFQCRASAPETRDRT